MGFKECLSIASFSIMLNGSPTGKIESNRCLRQGDPLSPYLFVLATEFWSISMDIALAFGVISPLKRSSPLLVSHLLFTDDMFVLCKGDIKSAEGLNEMLQKLELNAGLTVNKSKCKVYFSKGGMNQEVSQLLGVPVGCCQ